MAKKSDNDNLAAKLDLRRHFLRKYHADGAARVMDCCQGSGRLWFQLRREFVISSYWGLDLKPKRGRLKVDSVRILQQAGWSENVIDIDTYGSPWKHWEALLPRASSPLTVFITLGFKNTMPRKVGDFERRVLGMGDLQIPDGIAMRLGSGSTPWCVGVAMQHGLRVVEAVEATPGKAARYIGVRLEPTRPVVV